MENFSGTRMFLGTYIGVLVFYGRGGFPVGDRCNTVGLRLVKEDADGSDPRIYTSAETRTSALILTLTGRMRLGGHALG